MLVKNLAIFTHLSLIHSWKSSCDFVHPISQSISERFTHWLLLYSVDLITVSPQIVGSIFCLIFSADSNRRRLKRCNRAIATMIMSLDQKIEVYRAMNYIKYLALSHNNITFNRSQDQSSCTMLFWKSS